MVYLGIAVMGAGGALLRFFIGRLTGETQFPWATLSVNAVGGLVIGYVWYAFDQGGALGSWPSWLKTSFIVGFLGGLTTFSSYSLDTLRLATNGSPGWALANVAANNLIAIGLCYLGWRIAPLF
ncbi:MAG: CrcB family protein [Bdellovibrionales bacterium]|nr:CrcB family protein [Bdellovibrionales bacterium]